jgi:hypothetical protein
MGVVCRRRKEELYADGLEELDRPNRLRRDNQPTFFSPHLHQAHHSHHSCVQVNLPEPGVQCFIRRSALGLLLAVDPGSGCAQSNNDGEDGISHSGDDVHGGRHDESIVGGGINGLTVVRRLMEL